MMQTSQYISFFLNQQLWTELKEWSDKSLCGEFHLWLGNTDVTQRERIDL